MKLLKSFLLLSLMAVQYTGAAPASARCVPCPVTGAVASFCNVKVSDDLCVSGDTNLAGSLDVCGPVDIAGPVYISNTTPSHDCDEGALVVAGGLGVGGNLNVCGLVTAGSPGRAHGDLLRSIPGCSGGIACTGGSLELQVNGDAGVSGDLMVCGNEVVNNLYVCGTAQIGTLIFETGVIENLHITGNLEVDGVTTLGGTGLNCGVTGIILNKNLQANCDAVFASVTPSTNPTNGAVVVDGGLGVGGALNVAGAVDIINTTASNNCGNGALVVAGGVGIGGNLNVCGSFGLTGPLIITDTTNSTACTNGALVVAGGVGIGENLNVCGDELVDGSLEVGGIVTFTNGFDVVSCTEGAVNVAGGLAVAKSIETCGNVIIDDGAGVIFTSGGNTELTYYEQVTASGHTFYFDSPSGGGVIASDGPVTILQTRIGNIVTVQIPTVTWSNPGVSSAEPFFIYTDDFLTWPPAYNLVNVQAYVVTGPAGFGTSNSYGFPANVLLDVTYPRLEFYWANANNTGMSYFGNEFDGNSSSGIIVQLNAFSFSYVV